MEANRPPRRSATRLDLATGVLLAVLCLCALGLPSILAGLMDPYQAVHFAFVEQETRNYERGRTDEPSEPYIDPWGRKFIQKDISGEYAIYSMGVNGLDDNGKVDDILMHGPGRPCYRFGHTQSGRMVKWSRRYLFILAAVLCATYLSLRTVSRRRTAAREFGFTGLVGLPLAGTVAVLADVAHGWVPHGLYSAFESVRLVSFEVFIGGSLILATYMVVFALRVSRPKADGSAAEDDPPSA